MKPLTLEMTAFGPFSGTELIEFDALGEQPLFLINGPTGSGKTTILDGICFALYGRTTGDEREAEQMRCDAAAPDMITRVVLDFQLNGKHYQIAREPRQLRPRIRGEGFTSHQANAQLLSFDRSGKSTLMVPVKVKQATSEIETLIGLNVEQFRQVMVLPQGEFRNLLMADSSKREKIFSDLFQTQIYRRIEDALKMRSSKIRAAREACYSEQQGMLKSVEMQSETQLTETLAQQQTLLSEAGTAKKNAEQVRDQANTRYLIAKNTEQDYQRLERVQHRLQRLKADEQSMGQRRERLQRDRRATQIRHEHRAWVASIERLKQTEQNQLEAQQQLEKTLLAVTSALRDFDAAISREAELEAAKQQKNQLEAYRPRINALGVANDALGVCENIAGEAIQQFECREKQLQASREMLAEAVTGAEQLASRLNSMGEQQLQLQKLEQAFEKCQEISRTKQQLDHREREIKAQILSQQGAQTDLDGCIKAQIRLELEWHRGQAALLAATLEDGQPCPVCGSEHHPEPQLTEDQLPDAQLRQQAVVAVEGARDTLHQIRNQLTVLTTRRESLLETLVALGHEPSTDPTGSIKKLQASLKLQTEQVARLQADQQREMKLKSRVASLREQVAQYQTELEAVRSAVLQATSKQAVARSEVKTAESELPEAYRSAQMLETQIDRMSQTATAIQRKIDAAREHLQARQTAQTEAKARLNSLNREKQNHLHTEGEMQVAWLAALERCGFTDQAEYLGILLDDQQRSKIESILEQYDTDLAELRGVEQSLLDTLKTQPRPDLFALQTSLNASIEKFQLADQAHAQLGTSVSSLLRTQDKLVMAQAAATEIDAQYAIVGTLSDAANGKTGQRISLQRFVLSVLLDDVLLEASQRLKRMSKGRYALYRQQDRGKGGGASGLELMVEDAYTGRQRPVATLSGGESFIAALSLALGLSDVVQAYAGGIHLDTLFIDEGFGSLDPESLELAVNTLIDLQSSGRMVGVISHVPELKERINVRLDVIAERGGSHTCVVSG